MAVVDAVVGMEDPFDDTSMDTISLFEVLDHVSLVREEDGSGRGKETRGSGAIRATAVPLRDIRGSLQQRILAFTLRPQFKKHYPCH